MVENHDRRLNHVDIVYECDRRMDGRTDRQTDRITITKTVQRIVSHCKNVKKTRFYRKIKKNIYKCLL